MTPKFFFSFYHENAFTFSIELFTDEQFRAQLNSQNNDEAAGIDFSNKIITDFCTGNNEYPAVPDPMISVQFAGMPFDMTNRPSEPLRDMAAGNALVDSIEIPNVSRANQVAVHGAQALPQPVPVPPIAEENLPPAL